MKIIITMAMSHTWFWPQTCLTKLFQFETGLTDCDISVVVVDNSWEWSPAGHGVQNIGYKIQYERNTRFSKWHATALDHVIDHYDADFLFTMDTDVLILKDGWLKWYMDKMRDGVFAVGHWHGQDRFIHPGATLYRMEVLKSAQAEFKANKDPNMYWGENFRKYENILPQYAHYLDDVGAFSEKRGWPPGTKLKVSPSGQLKRAGWYEPGQQLFHWAIEKGWDYVVTPVRHEIHPERCIPIATLYGEDPYYLVHLWGGTRALDLLKHPVTDPTVLNNMGYWLEREAKYWKKIVPEDVQKRTIELIKEYGWIKTKKTDRQIEAIKVIENYYKKGGIPF